MRRVLLSTGLAFVTLMPALSASAQTRISIRGTTYICPNSCVITQYPDGSMTVRDSSGAPARIIQQTNQAQ
jgi:hypothetical protein